MDGKGNRPYIIMFEDDSKTARNICEQSENIRGFFCPVDGHPGRSARSGLRIHNITRKLNRLVFALDVMKGD